MDVVAARGAAAVRHKIHLYIADLAGVPIRRHFDRHLLINQPLDVRIGIAPQMPDALLPPQQSINRARRNLLQLTGHYTATTQFTQLPQTVQFASQHRHQPLAARLLENVPYVYQRCHHRRSVFRSPFSPLPRPWLKRVVQNPDQVLPVQAGTLLSLIQQPAPALLVGSVVLLADLLQVLLARVHVHLSWVSCFAPRRVTFSFDPTESSLVTF